MTVAVFASARPLPPLPRLPPAGCMTRGPRRQPRARPRNGRQLCRIWRAGARSGRISRSCPRAFFPYRVISRLGDAMDDGGTVPDRADGMGCFDLGNGEDRAGAQPRIATAARCGRADRQGVRQAQWRLRCRAAPPISCSMRRRWRSSASFRSLGGTIRNCFGRGHPHGGTWLTLRGSADRAGPTLWRRAGAQSRLGVSKFPPLRADWSIPCR